MNTEIDLILPCYNPDSDWEQLVVSKYKELQSKWNELEFHLYVVNDGSIKGFDHNAIDYIIQTIPDVHILAYPVNQGKGFALRKAVAMSSSDYILYTDYDFPYTIESMSKVLASLLIGVDVVIATRNKKYYSCLPFSRRWVSLFVRWCNRHLLQMKFPDTQAGLKGFNQKGRTVFLSTRIKTYLFDWEFVYKAGKDPSVIVKDVCVELRKNVRFSRFDMVAYLKELRCCKRVLF
ncbi:glycosyltransferase [Parabacteroides sp. AF48-14]|uniref:glycosyltransferase n=1 Tax=Parabacteroides sp. AF48-14 TaxID=2292052 RepID=UPI000F004AF6|nr:glycosyltransferase [Parabacteroides sp. AF48-14]RHO71485.1 glycosyltransferase [Parabacteroides sp. AF48-14]